ncbi:shikimate dehydrogenase family protein [Streptomyces montanisoli]|uniref:Shikimate dehydrogenase n=1 Tax=Streptomyces montanisoli TaxID=2798581 RepID=A0A940RXR2_9ACTN|nr:shikimate dehydrogenase [Streptomyces montanisoli]MBP0460840.1 shikimate dehydrogenase [Streptomyces montanisoli]
MKRLAVLGSPIGQALSPVLHRAAYQTLGLNWSYRSIDCTPDRLEPFLASLDDTWAGLSLTMPLKRLAVPLLDRVSDTVTRIGAANTVVVKGGRLVGENTDLHGMVQALHEAGVTSAAHVTVLGAGATACTALAAARELGCDHATVIARDARRARPTIEAAGERIRIRVRVEPWEAAAAHLSADLVISALPPGVADALAPLWTRTRATGTLMNVVYRPRLTVFGCAAEAAGRRSVDGLPMLVHQAARQVTLQTGCRTPPVDAMMYAASVATD